MKITITGGGVPIEFEVPTPANPRPQLPLDQRRKHVLDLVAKNRRSRLHVIDGGLPGRAPEE